MKLLVAIASYGRTNDAYLARVLAEYRSMPYQTRLVVLSNVRKDLGPDVEVIVGLPSRDPFSLPFAHKRVLAEGRDDHDLFIYSEDDMLITQRNIEAYLRVSAVMPPDELPGFFQYETYPDGKVYYPAVHHHFRWLPESVKSIGGYTFARYSNEHTACYLLTREQLKKAVASGGFLVGPHEGRYQIRESASTDPYTRCGLTKFLCLSHFDEFLVAHLPNRYVGSSMGMDAEHFEQQIQALLRYQRNGGPPRTLLDPEARVFHGKWSKDCYEPCRHDLLALVPAEARSVLSIGCGWGATEAELAKRGVRVTAIPVDPVLAAGAAAQGVEMVYGDLAGAAAQLAGRKFDAVLMAGILHLLPEPREALRHAGSLLAEGGVLVAGVANLGRLPFRWQRLRHRSRYRHLADYRRSGVHLVSRSRAAGWLRQAGFVLEKRVENVPAPWKSRVDWTAGLAAPLVSSEFVFSARKMAGKAQ